MSALYAPRAAAIHADVEGRPAVVGGVEVEAIREEWLVEDRWWTPEPVTRRYFELVLSGGRCEVVFAESGEWFSQRA